MNTTKPHYFEGSFAKLNYQNGLIGVLVGIIISVVRSVARERLVSVKDILLNIMFSIFITLSITNSVYIYERYLKRPGTGIWQFALVYYSCNIIGMLIGVEISYLIVSILFHVPYSFLQHFSDYKLSFIIVLIVGSILYFYNAQKVTLNARLKERELDLIKVKQLKTQAELQTLQSKINPHFLYNALNSIASLIHEDADRAEEMTLMLSKLFRYSINSQQESMACVKDEMEIVNTYLAIEKVRFGDRITFNIHVDEALLSCRIPRFLIQPLVENALKHGLNNTAQNGRLTIELHKVTNRLLIKIADNGSPFPAELNMGYGLQSTYEKLKLLYQDDYDIQLTNNPQKQITISLPIQ